MTFYADLHIHSKYSRATSKHCDLEHLAYWACRKGIDVVGTGDFTHPAWRVELQDKLVPAEPGLFRLRPDCQRWVDDHLDSSVRAITRFMLSVEISTIYKKDGDVRKVHHLLYAPDFEHVDAIVARLAKIGNLAADGRPILGLDSRDLLEITLEAGPHAYLIPAHVWTPWFAVLGSKSGFDRVDACYGDLAGHIFAIETGLSSDPEMNWRLSQLDRYTLVSNSDAHSPAKLGREVNRFDCELSYFAMRNALETRRGFGGTIEFFPEEGKYHLDGHRKCGVVLAPEETRAVDGRCPVCTRPLTVGVMNRVQTLADRPLGFKPQGASPYRCLIPLPEVIAEIVGTGVNSKTVGRDYEQFLRRIGNEFFILEHAQVEDIARAGSPPLAEAVSRMRAGRVIRKPGYDGEYGVIRVFEDDELAPRRRSGRRRGKGAKPPIMDAQATMFADTVATTSASSLSTLNERDGTPAKRAPTVQPAAIPKPFTVEPARPTPSASSSPPPPLSRFLASLDPEQQAAAALTHGPLLIVAGPGTGKTRTLTHRIAHLVADRDVAPEACLAITFTNRAAREMHERLIALLPDQGERVAVMTFHALALGMLREHRQACGLHRGFRIASDDERARLLAQATGTSERGAQRMLGRISVAKRTGDASFDSELLDQYASALEANALIDFDDVLLVANRLLADDLSVRALYRHRYAYISIDEYQDIDELQYRLVTSISPETLNLCAIGDPDQAIYGFRGADVGFFLRFERDFSGARRVTLSRNYRSSTVIVEAALDAIRPSSLIRDRQLVACGQSSQVSKSARFIDTATLASERGEAEFVAHRIEQLIGGTSFFSLDSGRVSGDGTTEDGYAPGDIGFSDIAILYRTQAQLKPLVEALSRLGVPAQTRSHGRLTDLPYVADLLSIMQRTLNDVDERNSEPVANVLLRARDALIQQTARASSTSCEIDPPITNTSDDPDPVAVQAAFERLLPIAQQVGLDIHALHAHITCGSDMDTWDARAERVSVLTMHAAKGLEFRVVFVIGCEHGIIPLQFGSALTDEQLAEERRLFFVALTRAKELLCLTRSRTRLWHGQVRETTPSSFLDDIAERHLTTVERRSKRRSTSHEQLGLQLS